MHLYDMILCGQTEDWNKKGQRAFVRCCHCSGRLCYFHQRDILDLKFSAFFFLSLSIYRCLCVWVSLSLSGSPSGAVCVPLSLSGSPSGTVCVSPSFFRSLSLSDSSSLLLSLSLIHV